MNYRDAERRFQTIDRQYRAGRIAPETYRAQIRELKVVDENGRRWMIQEGTGQWHVYDEGEWRAASPPKGGSAPGGPRAGKRRRWLAIGCVTVAAAVCLCGALSGILFFPELADSTPALDQPEAGQVSTGGEDTGEDVDPGLAAPSLELAAEETLPVPADGSPVSDGRGATLEVPAEASPEGGPAQMTVYEPEGALLDGLRQEYVVETPFYAVTLQGSDDSTGRATLQLPAAGSDSRIVVLIDRQHLIPLDVEPEGGILTLHPRLGPSESIEGERVGSVASGGTIHYAVIRPRAGAGMDQRAPGLSGWPRDPRDCSLPSGRGITHVCRKNAAGSLLVTHTHFKELSNDQMDVVVDRIEQMAAAYAQLGFAAARIGRHGPMRVMILPGSGDPLYHPASMTIRIPGNVAIGILENGDSRAARDLRHEMAHWIQDEEYPLLWNFWWGDQTWWLEVAAENMVMLTDEDRLGENFRIWGDLIMPGKRLPSQFSPYQWPWSVKDLYVHAHLVKVNMCDDTDVCPISQASFVKAINEGSYPFDDESARAKVSANLDDYARYLLGVPPKRANQTISLSPEVRRGLRYCDYVEVSQKGGNDFQVDPSGYPPQMTVDKSGPMREVVIDAVLEKDGVYPLRVENGLVPNRGPGLPVALRISPGVPFWYRVGEGEAQFHEGQEELVIQPIHARMGVPSVRVVALGRAGGEHFRARVGMVDLSGAWVLYPDELVSNSITCTGDGEADMEEATAELAATMIGFGSALGDHLPEEEGNGLTWHRAPGRVTGELGDMKFSYASRAVLGTDRVDVTGRFHIPRPSTEGPGRRTAGVEGWALMATLALGGAVPLVVWARYPGWPPDRGRGRCPRRRWRIVLLVTAAVVAALFLTGCFGLIFYGDATGDVTFRSLEYVGGESTAVLNMEEDEPAGEPIWRLRDGRGTFDVELTVEVFTEDEGKEEKTTDRCRGTAVYEMEGAIYKDAVVDLSD